jgi:hypothetical protein
MKVWKSEARYAQAQRYCDHQSADSARTFRYRPMHGRLLRRRTPSACKPSSRTSSSILSPRDKLLPQIYTHFLLYKYLDYFTHRECEDGVNLFCSGIHLDYYLSSCTLGEDPVVCLERIVKLEHRVHHWLYRA